MAEPTSAAEDRGPGRPISRHLSIGGFTGRLLVVILVGSLAAALWQLIDILALLFAASLLAIGLCAAARQLTRATGLRKSVALSAVVVTGFAACGASLWLFGSAVAAQLSDVLRALPAGFTLSLEWLKSNPYGRLMLDQARGVNVVGATGWATSIVTTGMGWITRGVGYAVLTLFVAIYLAAQPDHYRHLFFRLVPPPQRRIAEHLFDVVGDVLRHWLVGQCMVMAAVALMTGIGLYGLGVNAAVALALIAGFLCFIPYLGAILAAIPAMLVALTQGPTYAAAVFLLYAGVHVIEGNVLTPLVQAKATALPPVLAILSTLMFGLLFGAAGVLMAAPLTLFALAVVEVLYVQGSLGEPPAKGAIAAHHPPRPAA